MIRYKLQNLPNTVNTGHTVLYGRVGTCTRISLVLNTPVKFQCIVFSSYYERMAAMTYVLVHVLRNPHQNSTKIIRRFSFFVPRNSTGLYLPVWSSAKVLHIVHELCENTIRLGTNYKMYQTQ